MKKAYIYKKFTNSTPLLDRDKFICTHTPTSRVGYILVAILHIFDEETEEQFDTRLTKITELFRNHLEDIRLHEWIDDNLDDGHDPVPSKI